MAHDDQGRAFDLEALTDDPNPAGPRLRVLLLADDCHAANVVRDHIDAFRRHSHHRVAVVNPIQSRRAHSLDFDEFDVLILHYSICILFEYFLPKPVEEKVKRFRGVKIQVIQDEYRWIDAMASKMAELGIAVVLSSLETHNLRCVYRQPEVAGITFYSTLPGYIPASLTQIQAPPIAKRPFHVVYRGREVPFWLGALSQEKARIATQLRSLADRHGLTIDVASKEGDRIYGRRWNRFLSSGKAVLATEGGASIFDFDGRVEELVTKYLERYPDADFETVAQAVLKPFEGNIVHRTITPRCLEAIAVKSALVMYPGRYRGVLKPWRHYIPLMPDGSNEDEVARLLKDDAYLQALADRCHAEIVERGLYAMRRYVRAVDAAIDRARAGRQDADRARRPVPGGSWQDIRVGMRHRAVILDMAVERRLRRYRKSLEQLRQDTVKKVKVIAAPLRRCLYLGRRLLAAINGR